MTALTPALRDSRFLKACRGEPVDATPVWLMRQAGRYMKEYRDVRAKVAFAELCKRPALAAEVTDTAARRIGADASIVFSDILLILEPMGARLEYPETGGPRILTEVASPADVAALRAADPGELEFVYDAVRQSRAALPANIPLIGFSGAPFTLAAYLIEGRSAREAEKTRIFMRTQPAAWDALMKLLVDGLVPYLTKQAEAGAQALQVFDTWVGALGPADFKAFVAPHVTRLLAALPRDVPTLYFGTGTAGILDEMAACGSTVMGIDARTGLKEARERLGARPVQGNLDPTVLFAERAEIRRAASAVLGAAGGRPGHIFNLGHGVLPGTPVDHVIALIDTVHELSSATRG